MAKRQADRYGTAPWHVPVAVEDIAESGQHFDLVAGAEVCAEVARMAGLRDLPRFEASFDVTRHGAGNLHVTGCVSATVGQTCVVTLDPLTNEVEEMIDLLFAPPSSLQQADESESEDAAREATADKPEPLIGGRIDLGALAAEFLVLGLDPYPRKPGAVFHPPDDLEPDAGPFAALAGLKRDRDGD